ncbi:LysR family transcriptional regulator [Variovorax sp. PAMC26660]|uniref:LysR family transcriptional regulator n=1 Tax=Variovorax sp. PAMC26660 TaxID=2762322 RepID=UPI00164DB179|nr:LysR family transcriptional regulator [Variovorax sp. PAMC26660]QNK67214.1 LysR family transcriptional regulator [Variovorax sp. PAMC26660]
MIEFRQLRQFVVLAEELNFGRAAIRLHMSQPPLSVAMRNLEAQVGAMLFDRSRHHVRLTPAGQVFHKDAQRLLQQVQAATERARRAAQGLEGSLRLSFVPSAALNVLPAIFKRFQHDYPTVQLRLTAETTARQLEDLRKGEVELALVVGPVYEARDLVLVDLQAQKFVIAVPRSHPLATRSSVKIKELAAEPFISFPASEGAGFVAALLGACQSAGFLPKVVQEAAQMQSILTLVAGGLGIALVPASMRTLAMADVVFLEIAGTRPPPTYQLVFAHTSHNDNPVVQSFLSVARKTVELVER